MDYSGMGLSPTTLSRLGVLLGNDDNGLPEASQRQRVRRASLSEADLARIRREDSAAHELARSSQTEADAARIRREDSAARELARSSQTEADAARIRRENSDAHVRARSQLRDSAAAAADDIDATLLASVNFSEAQLDYAVKNFERSPSAALAFTVANSGICNTPDDLGPLLDGIPDAVTEECVRAFIKTTDLSLVHGCACCGMRTTNCTSIAGASQFSPYAMTDRETAAFDSASSIVQQLRSTILLQGVRYLLHPELVNIDAFSAWRCAVCTAAKLHVHPLSEKHKPDLSVRGGCDFGDIRRLRVSLTPLTLVEQCILRRSRCYRHYIKCSKPGSCTKLKGHVVLVPQDIPDALVDSLRSRVDAARTGISIIFGGSRALLLAAHAAKSMAHILDVRKPVLLQWLSVFNASSPEHHCPRLTAELLSADADELVADLPGQIVDAAVHDDTHNMQHVDEHFCDDVAAVRALSDEHASDRLDRVIIMPRHPTMSVEEQRRRETDAINASIKIIPHSALENEFGDQRAMLSRAFPWIFPLGAASSFPLVTGTLSAFTVKHMFEQCSCAAAHDDDLGFFIADQQRRHDIVRASAAAVASGHVEEFRTVTESQEFITELAAARAGDEAAMERCANMLRPFITIGSARVMNGPAQRAKAQENILAIVHEQGLPSMFLTVAPDFVHSSGAIRLSFPETAADFPLDAFLDSLGTGSVFASPGWTSVDMGTASLNKRMAQNPYAAANDFVKNMHAVMTDLLKCPPQSSTRKTTANWRICGVFGTPYSFYCVVEAQGRGALHYHLIFWGSYSPRVLSQAVADPSFKERICKALSSQTTAELPRALHVQRLKGRALVASGEAYSPAVRQSRLPRCLVPNVSDLSTRALSSASGSCVHGHSQTCHQGEMGKSCCRTCNPNRPCDSAVHRFTLVSASGSTQTIPIIDEDCTNLRELQQFPIPAIDHRCIVVEAPRRRDDAPLLQEETAGLSDRSCAWMRKMLPLQNMLVSAFNKTVMACVPSNQNAVQLSCDNAAKAMSYYLSGYVGKDSNALKASLSMFIAAQAYIDQHPSVAPDTGTAKRTAQHLLTNTCNRITGAMEVSDQQAAMTVLGHTADLSSAPFWRCMVMPAVKYVQSLRPPRPVVPAADGNASDGVERIAALEHDAPAINPDEVDVSEPVYDAGTSVKSVPQHINYAERGDELRALSLYDYCRLVLIKPIAASAAQSEQHQQRQTGAGRQCNRQFRFNEAHPLHGSHVQTLRSKICTVVVRPSPPRMPEFDTCTPSIAQLQRAALPAAFYTVLLKPWSVDALPDTDYASWAEWTVELSTDPTAVNKYRLGVMTAMSHGLATSAANIKASKAYRFQYARRWNSTGVDGTEPPPGRYQEPEQPSQPDALDSSVLDAVEELQRMANPRNNDAVEIAKYNRLKDHIKSCSVQMEKLFPTVPVFVPPINDQNVPVNAAVSAIPCVRQVAQWKDSSLSAALALTFLKDVLVDRTEEVRAPIVAAGQADIQWPTTDGLSESQVAAVAAIQPYLANRSTPPCTFMLNGGPGSGKTYTIKHMQKMCNSAGVKIRCGAFAAAAAMPLPNGQTVHSLVGIGLIGDEFPPQPCNSTLNQLRAAWQDVQLFVIDEISMVSLPLLGIVSHRLSLILDNPQPFGGLLTVLSGDFSQLPPIPEPSLATAVVDPPLDLRVGSPSALAIYIFSNLHMLPLVQQQRCDDPEWNRVLDACRSSGTLDALVPALQVLSEIETRDDPLWKFATVATVGNELRAHINSIQSTRWVIEHQSIKLRWRCKVHKWYGGAAPADEFEEYWQTDPRICGEFVPDLEVVINDNICAASTEKGVANGRRAKLYGVAYDDTADHEHMLQQISIAQPGDIVTLRSPPDFVIVDVGNVEGMEFREGLMFNPSTGGMLLPMKAHADPDTKIRCLINGSIYNLTVCSFPYDMLFCVTIHKLQGMTLNRLILDLTKPVYPPHHTFEAALVAASRVRKGAHVRVLRPGWAHLLEYTADRRVRSWLAGFDSHGGVWNRARAMDAMARSAPAVPARGKKRGRAAPTGLTSALQASAGNTRSRPSV